MRPPGQTAMKTTLLTIYSWVGVGLLSIAAVVAALVLIPLFSLRLALVTPVVFSRLEFQIRRARRLLRLGHADRGELKRLLLTMEGLNTKGTPAGFSWVRERTRKKLAGELLTLREKL